ncbi:hypothetical protein AB6A40_003048 [Gnathostoma spinigerum]|uniref:Adenine phosphoribosyltransferase n=1 Tax=Gnathostoma spinigerum TaxID=75299 RepID=A0ABD6EG68_9BILA
MSAVKETLATRNKRELQHLKEEVRSHLRIISDFPKPGIRFVDIMPLFRQPSLLNELCHAIAEHVRVELPVTVNLVTGLEARGFLFGPSIAMALNVPFFPIRKRGKLPGKIIQETYTKEYGDDVVEVQADAIVPGSKVLLVDDLLATGGTLAAAVRLIEKAGGDVVEAFTLIELTYLNARKTLPKHIPVYSLITLDE